MIAIDELSLQYSPRAEAVFSGLSHVFESGTLTVVSGPSGSGKSTLLYVIGLLLRPTLGRIIVDDTDVARMPDADRARLRAASIGFVFQDALLDPARTVRANVLQGAIYGRMRHVSAQAVDALLAKFGVTGRGDHRPGQISGGQAQRVALCRALIKQPSIILADEPTGNLDTESGEVVWQALHEQAERGATVIVATHDPSRVAGATSLLRIGG